MSTPHRTTLASGNVVVVDDSGARVYAPDGKELRSFDFQEIKSIARDDAAVVLTDRNGKDWTLPTTDPKSAVDFEWALRSQIAAEATPPPSTKPAKDQVDYDNGNQMERIRGGLVPGETLFAVYDMKGGGTGFIGITDRRIITQDENSFGQKRRSLVSIPYSHISMLASRDEGGIMRKTSALTVITSSGLKFDFEFRNGDKAERAYTFIIQHLR